MPAAKSSRSSKPGATARAPSATARKAGATARKAGATAGATARKAGATARAPSATARKTAAATGVADSLAAFAEQLANRVIRPLDMVLLTRERIQETLDEAAERGRVTRSDANDLVSELITRGRQQTEDLLGDVEQLLGRGREQLESATRRARRTDPVDRLVRGADRARRTVNVGPSFPILGYDDLTSGQVEDRLAGLSPADLRRVREYERRHANRKSVLAAVEKALA